MEIKNKPESVEIIISIEDWLRLCPPARGDFHWKDNRSAKELARYWVNKENQIQFSKWISTALDGHFEAQLVLPEYNTPFDSYRGNSRQNDLLIQGRLNGQNVIVSVEAKADESFGNTIGVELKEKINYKLSHPTSKAFNRIIDLWNSIGKSDDNFLSYRYQLFHWVAGSLAAAKRLQCHKAICIVHTFISSEIDKNKKENNMNDFNAFLSFISNHQVDINNGEILGPFYVNGNVNIPNDVELYLGYLETNL